MRVCRKTRLNCGKCHRWDMSNSEKLRQILEDHELYRSVQKMSSYAASTAAMSSSSYHPGSSQATIQAFEHRMPRAQLSNSTSGKASPSSDKHLTGNYVIFCISCAFYGNMRLLYFIFHLVRLLFYKSPIYNIICFCASSELKNDLFYRARKY